MLTTLKALRPLASFVLSEAPDHPVLGVAVVGYSGVQKRAVVDVYNNDGCLVRWIVEDDPTLVQAAKDDVRKLGLEDVQGVPTSRYRDAIADRFVRVVIIGGPHQQRHTHAEQALRAGKNVLCDRPIAMTVQTANDLFETARASHAIFMPMLPGRPGKAFSAVVMSLFASAERVACQRHLPEDFKQQQPPPEISDPETQMILADVAMQDVFAVNFSINTSQLIWLSSLTSASAMTALISSPVSC